MALQWSPMKKAKSPICLLLCLTLSACGPGGAEAEQPTDIPQRSFAVAGDQTVQIEVNVGLIRVVGIPGDEVEVEGKLLYPAQTDFDVTESPAGLNVSANYRGSSSPNQANPPVEVEVRVPFGQPMRITTTNASTELNDYDGSAEVSSVAGDIRARNLTGTLWLRSRRGALAVVGGKGEFHLVGESGPVTIDGTDGEVAATTIMGDISYLGTVSADEGVRLEADHGAVEIRLGGESNANVTVSTASGFIRCMLPDLHPVIRGCSGTLQDGAGNLEVRTVSGAVTIQNIP